MSERTRRRAKPISMKQAKAAIKQPVVIARVQTGFCQVYATYAMNCPRCGVLVPRATLHKCGEESAR